MRTPGGWPPVCAAQGKSTLWPSIPHNQTPPVPLHSPRCWGWNNNGQIGAATSTPSQMTSPTGQSFDTDWAYAFGGESLSCGIRANGTVYCWGLGSAGRIGDGTTSAQRKIPTAINSSFSYTTVAAGNNVVCAVLGTPAAANITAALPPTPPEPVFTTCWGTNSQGQFANGETSSAAVNEPAPNVGEKKQWASISLSQSHACAVDGASGALRCWGVGSSGQLGQGTTTNNYAPTTVSGGGSWKMAYAANSWSCGIMANGSMYCWGTNSGNGYLGDGTTATRLVPTLITPNRTWSRLPSKGSDTHTCAIDAAGLLFCWVGRVDGEDGLLFYHGCNFHGAWAGRERLPPRLSHAGGQHRGLPR